MPLILDTFNVLHTVGILPPDLAGLDVPGLAVLMLRSRYRSERVTFVCDGLPPGPPADLPPPGPLLLPGHDEARQSGSPRSARPESSSSANRFLVRYAGRSLSADDLIRDIVAASTAPRRLIVISSDHAVQRHARKRRCAVLSSEEFLQHLADDAQLADRLSAGPKPQRPIPSMMSREQVEKWMEVFDVDEKALAQDVEGEGPSADASAPRLPSSPPPQLPPQAGTERSAVPSQPSATPIVPAPPAAPAPPSPLPADLIAQAEQLWRSHQPSRVTPDRTLGLTSDAGSEEDPDRARHPQPSLPPASAQPTRPLPPSPTPENNDPSHLASLDMDAILPADGRTQPLRKRTERQRPPPRDAK